MGKITRMPIEKRIGGFRGVIDFYYYMGKPCARRWPASPGHRRSPPVEAQWIPFKEAARLAKLLPPAIIEYYRKNTAGQKLTWKDIYFRSYLSGLPTEVYTGKE